MATDALESIDRLKNELDALRPLPADVVERVEQKLRIESNYHSNAVEGNSLTLGETRSLILRGLTARGKPMRDHLDIEGHDRAVEIVETSTGETYYFTPPEQVKPAMTDLLDWYRAQEAAGEHPVIIAATFHYRFVRIHPFDDGNGRMARLIMNLILIKHGYTVAIVQSEERARYLEELERADHTEDLAQFIEYIASCCTYALDLYLRAARGESIEDPEDIDREIELFKRSVARSAGPEDQVPLKQYAERVVHPFYLYCLSKFLSGNVDLIDGRGCGARRGHGAGGVTSDSGALGTPF